jgi:hypothetical protein
MYRIIVVCLVLLITACGEADKLPEGVLSKEEMKDVLLDMNMADAYSSIGEDGQAMISDSVRKERVRIYYRQILDLHKLTLKEFDKSYNYYEGHPDKLKDIYDMMMVAVTKDKDDLDLDARKKEYLKNPHSLLPYGKNTLISTVQDTIIPFVKKNKRINDKRLPPRPVNLSQ